MTNAVQNQEDNSLMNNIPAQKLISSKKNKAWREANVNSIIAKSINTSVNGRSSRADKLINYDLMNSKFDPADFEYVTNAHNIPKEEHQSIPIQMFNIVRSKVERLKGEEIERLFGFMAIGTDGEVLHARTEARKKVIRSYFEKQLQAELGQPQKDAQGNIIPQPELEKMLKDFDTNWKDIREKWVNDILHYLKYRENLELKFNECWEHALISGEEVCYTGISNGEPKLRVVNPPNFWYDKTPQLRRIQDSERALEERIMSKGEILDEYGEMLEDDDLAKIDANQPSWGSMSYNQMLPGYQIPAPSQYANSERSILDNNGNYGSYGKYNNFPLASSPGQYTIYCCVWKSWKKWGFLTYMDENGDPQTKMVEDTFRLDDDQKEQGWTIEWTWRTEVWVGHKIMGLNIYFGIEPLENQIDGELPYIGRIYNSVNSQSTSLVSLIKPYQMFHTMVWHKVKKEAAKAKGKKFRVDLAQLPKGEGWNLDKWFVFFDEKDIDFYNSMQEGREGDPNSIARNSNNANIDMSMSSTVPTLMNLLDRIEYAVDSITGISKQREGDIGASETATNAGRAIVQSTYITEPMFYIHNEFKKDVLNHLVKIAKVAYQNGKTGNFVFGDMINIMLQVDGGMLNDSEYDVFITGSPADRKILEDLKSLAPLALQSDKANFSEMIKIYKSTSIAEVETAIIAGEQDKIQRDQEDQDNQNSTQIQQQTLINQNAQAQRDWESTENQKKLDNAKEIAQIGQLGISDTNANSVPDILEISKLDQQAKEHQKETILEQDKLNFEKTKHSDTVRLKEKELKIKDKGEQNKLKVAKYKSKSKPK